MLVLVRCGLLYDFFAIAKFQLVKPAEKPGELAAPDPLIVRGNRPGKMPGFCASDWCSPVSFLHYPEGIRRSYREGPIASLAAAG